MWMLEYHNTLNILVFVCTLCVFMNINYLQARYVLIKLPLKVLFVGPAKDVRYPDFQGS